MANQIFSLDELVKLKEQEEKEREKLPYETYLDNLIKMVEERHPKVVDMIESPAADGERNYICIKEPLEFLDLFQELLDSQEACKAYFKQLIEQRDPRVVGQIIIPQEEKTALWFNSTKKGINLRPGLENEELSSPNCICLGDDCVHGVVAGRTGSGKSVFLNSLLFSLMAEYAPWELHIFLADFKKVELSRYLSRCATPHIKAVAATSEVRYVVSLLNYLNDCMKARQKLFSVLGLQKLSDVREEYGIVLPRVLLLVDEFQQLFLEATAREQATVSDLLTSITKLGRATGYHLLFASQEMTGTMGNSAFANFKARFALACDADVSAAIIGNRAAADITKKGIVIANTASGKDYDNRTFKVPFISNDYFYHFLQQLCDLGEKYGYDSVHKFYDEDAIKSITNLEEVLDKIEGVRRDYLVRNNSLFDILTLGEAVVFNYKKYDYETVFLERGVRKNIGIFSPFVDDAAYISKMLVENFKSSPKKEKYQHFALIRNDLFVKKYNFTEELGIPANRIFYSNDLLTEVVNIFKRRKEQTALINNYEQYAGLKEFSYSALCLRAKYIYPYQDDMEEIKETFKEISTYFENVDIKDIPETIDRILNEYSCDRSYFYILELLHRKETLKLTNIELFDPQIFWIVGAEMLGRSSRDLEEVLTDAMNYNMLFVIVSNNDFDDFSTFYKTCDYLFINGNLEKFYMRFDIPFTKKGENSIAIDFGIRSSATQRSFKKFKYQLAEVVVPTIDFDSLL